MSYILLAIILAILMLPGLLGVFLPVPGLGYMFLLALTYGFIDHFSHLSTLNLLVLAVILALSIVSDIFSGLIGAKYGGASKQSIFAGMIGLIVGLIVLPPFGGLMGLFAGVLIWEIYSKSSKRKALKVATSSLIGSVAGMIISLVLSILFIALFLVYAIN